MRSISCGDGSFIALDHYKDLFNRKIIVTY